MVDKKTPVDTLITADYVITMDAAYTIYAPGAVAVTGPTVTAAGPQDDILAAYKAEERIDAGEAIVMPGLVNAHGHAPMALLRGMADDLRLDVWLMGYMMPVENDFVDPKFCWLGTQLAAAEMIRSGTTTFLDMYYFEEAVADATAQAGLRAVCSQSILKFPAPDAPTYEDALSQTRDFILRWNGHPLVIPAVAPHAPYTVTPHLLHEAVGLAQEFDVPLHIHIAETAQEVEDHRQEYGMPPVPWLKKQGIFEAKTSAAHCVHLDEGEITTLTHYNVGVVHNPSSNLKLASGIAPVHQMLEKGLNVGIGTDGPASNNDLDMFEEMRLTSFLGKVSTMDPTVIPARKALEMATIMGARALHIDEITGSLEVGKRADLIIVRMDRVRHAPTYQRDPDNVYSRLVYTAHAEDVQHSMVNGRWLMRDHQLLSLDPGDLRAEANAMAQKIDAFLVKREESVLSKLLAIGGVDQEKTFEVQVKVHQHDLDTLRARVMSTPEITVQRGSKRDQYDTYFLFDDRWGSVLRYREDEVLDEKGTIIDAIYRLTLTTQRKEREYKNSVLLSRSRFDAPATRSLRFYREYFAPETVIKVCKHRERYHIRYGNTEFAINLDKLTAPEAGEPHAYFEIKSRTWSRQDAEHKAQLISELLELLDVPTDAVVKEEYVQLVQKE